MTEEIIALPVTGDSTFIRMARLFNDKSSSDVTFLVGKLQSQFFGHIAIIGSASDVFKAQFSGDWKDSKVITLENVDEDAFAVLMTYIYTDDIRLREGSLLNVLELGHRYMMTELLSALTSEATFSQYCKNHVWKYLTFGHKINDMDLIFRCLDVIDREATFVFELTDFSALQSSFIDLIVGRNSLFIEESKLFDFLIKWSEAGCQRRNPPLEVTPGNQRKVMESFIHKIRFSLMTSEEFAFVEKTGILNPIETQQIKAAINGDIKYLRGFDFNPRISKILLLSNLKCGGIMPKVLCGYDRDTRACIPCAFKCHPNIQQSTWEPYHGYRHSCSCISSGKCKIRY